MSNRLKKTFLIILLSALGCITLDQAVLARYMDRNFSDPDECRRTEIRKYPIKSNSIRLDNRIENTACFSGPIYNLVGKTVGGTMGLGDDNSPILTHDECCRRGHNFNLDSITYIMAIDTLTSDVKSFPSYDKKYGDMAYDYCQDTNSIKDKIVIQNGNYLMIRGGIHPLNNRKKHNMSRTLRLAFGTDGDGNYVFVKFFGTINELQEFLKSEFGRDNPDYNNQPGSKYTKAAFMYLDGNNIMFDGKCYVAQRESFIGNTGIVRWLKLQYVKRAQHLIIKSK